MISSSLSSIENDLGQSSSIEGHFKVTSSIPSSTEGLLRVNLTIRVVLGCIQLYKSINCNENPIDNGQNGESFELELNVITLTTMALSTLRYVAVFAPLFSVLFCFVVAQTTRQQQQQQPVRCNSPT